MDEEQLKKAAEQLDQLKPPKEFEALEKAFADFEKRIAYDEAHPGRGD